MAKDTKFARVLKATLPPTKTRKLVILTPLRSVPHEESRNPPQGHRPARPANTAGTTAKLKWRPANREQTNLGSTCPLGWDARVSMQVRSQLV